MVAKDGSKLRRSLSIVPDRRTERGEKFYELVRTVAAPFVGGAVPTANVYGSMYERLTDGVKTIYPELEPLWEHLKAGSTGYITSAAILSHPTFVPSRTAIGFLSSRVGDGAPRQEWVFASTGPDDPIIYATLQPGVQETRLLKHTNSLAATILESGSTDFGPFRTAAGAPRLDDHWPKWTGFSEEDLRRFLQEQDRIAREVADPPGT